MYKDLMEIDSRFPLSYLTNQYFPDVPLYKGPYEASVELAFDPPMHRLVPGVPKDLPPEHVLIFKLTEQEEDARRQVVKRDDDLLTAQQIKDHWEECIKAMMKELATWHSMKCFSRKPRHQARNIIDTRWVLKWKYDKPLVDALTGKSSGPGVKIIRARLTVRGFKDRDKEQIARYAGTSSRSSQKVLVSEAVRNGWDICTTDISKAFL